jgi:hypothetical protein
MKSFREIINPVPEASEETQAPTGFPTFTDFIGQSVETPSEESK